MSLVQIDEVTKTFNSDEETVTANDNVTLAIDEGEVYGLFGHNGAGKTTLVNQMLGLLQPDSGSIHIAGEDIVATRARGRYLCSVQPQGKTPLGELTPRHAIRLMGELRGLGDAEVARRTDSLLEALDIGEWADKPSNLLSGGVQRLTSFALAAVAPGRVVVLDEPTNDVDPVRRRLLWKAIRDISTDGTSVLVVTHNIQEAEAVVDRAAILDSGRVLVQGDLGEIRSESSERGVMKLVTTSRIPISELTEPDWAESMQVDDGALVIKFQRDHASQALAWASENHGTRVIGDYALSEVSLEDIYVSLVAASA